MTKKNRSFRVSPALVISCLALLLALTGSAIAAGVAKNSVRSAQIVDSTVRTVDLRDGAVNSAKVADESLTATDLAPDSVGTSEIAADAVGTSEIAADSVGTGELQNSSVRASELGPIVTVSNSTTIKGGNNASVDVACPAGTVLISGGARGGFYQVALSASYRSGNGWHVDARSGAVNDTTLTAYANCLAG